MPYYRAGDYYRGDYYRGNYAAGGIFGSIGKFIGGAVKKVGSALVRATPVGAVISSLIPTYSRPQIAPMAGNLPSFGPGTGMSVPEPGITGGVHRLAPGGHPGYGRYKKDGTWTERARPRMDYGNMKALRRADRRAHGFLRAYTKAVRHFVAKAKPGKAYVHFKKKKS